MAICEQPPAQLEEVDLMFNLTTGLTVSVHAIVRHSSDEKQRFGVEFLNLPHTASSMVGEYCRSNLKAVRRSGRVSKRILVTIRAIRIGACEELAETCILSRSGGLLATRAKYAVGDHLELHWIEKKQSIEIEVVSCRPTTVFAIVEVGFRFVPQNRDFWEMEFPDA